MLVYLDNCCYNRPFDDQTHLRIKIETLSKMHIQALIVSNELDLAVSFVSRGENNA